MDAGDGRSDRVRRWVALTAPFATSAVLIVLVPVELAGRGLVGWVAAAAGAWALMQGAGSLVVRRALGLLRGPGGVRAAVAAIGAVAAGAAVAVSVLDGPAAGAVLVAASVVGGALWPVLQVASRAVLARWGPEWIRRAGPASRVSAAVSAVVATAIAVSPVPVWAGVFLAAGVLGSAVFWREFAALPAGRVAGSWSWRSMAGNGLMAFAGYGPVLLYVPLVVLTAGPEWTGAAMAAYAGGALAAPAVSRHVRWARSSNMRVWVVAAAATVPLWAAAGAVAGAGWAAVVVVLVVRAVSGTVLFVVEGSADIEAARTGTFAPALAGRNIAGALVAATAGAAVAAGAGFWVAFAVLASAAAVAVAVAVAVLRREPAGGAAR